jgi:hypothetical protein
MIAADEPVVFESAGAPEEPAVVEPVTAAHAAAAEDPVEVKYDAGIGEPVKQTRSAWMVLIVLIPLMLLCGACAVMSLIGRML